MSFEHRLNGAGISTVEFRSPNQIRSTVAIALGAVFASSAFLAAEQSSVSSWRHDAERFRNLEVFGVVAHRSLDTDCDVVVELVDLASVQGCRAKSREPRPG